MQELKRCPFCGGESVLLNSSREIPEESAVFWVYCKNCSATSMTYDKREEAIECWNTRTPGWIPVEERLPEEPKENPEFDNKPLELYLVDIGESYPLRAFWNGKQFADGWSILKVIAWMPLPEPYTPKKGAEECQNEES